MKRSALTIAVLAAVVILSAASAQAETQKRKGFFARIFSAPAQQQDSTAEDGMAQARAVLKAAVAVAVENRPSGRLWCVPFARAITGVSLKGNARTWWKQAAGRYERGNEPVIGAVMNFSGSRAMPMGHVAVVSAVVNDREILVDHANWERNRISLDARVIDVSPDNDWSEVRVANSAGTLGRVNPVYGFIYTPITPRG